MKWLRDAMKKQIKEEVYDMLEELDVNPEARYDWSGITYGEAFVGRIVGSLFEEGEGK